MNTPPVDGHADIISRVLTENVPVVFACLVGSRAQGKARPDSGWDIAVWSDPRIGPWARHVGLCGLQGEIAFALKVSAVDLIDLHSAGLAMRLEVASRGWLLKQDKGSEFNRFLVRVWREQEDIAYDNALGARLAA